MRISIKIFKNHTYNKWSQEWEGGSRLARAEEIPPSFLGQGRKSRGESPAGRRRNATACSEDDSLRMTLLQDLVKRPPPWSKSKYRDRLPRTARR